MAHDEINRPFVGVIDASIPMTSLLEIGLLSSVTGNLLPQKFHFRRIDPSVLHDQLRPSSDEAWPYPETVLALKEFLIAIVVNLASMPEVSANDGTEEAFCLTAIRQLAEDLGEPPVLVYRTKTGPLGTQQLSPDEENSGNNDPKNMTLVRGYNDILNHVVKAARRTVPV